MVDSPTGTGKRSGRRSAGVSTIFCAATGFSGADPFRVGQKVGVERGKNEVIFLYQNTYSYDMYIFIYIHMHIYIYILYIYIYHRSNYYLTLARIDSAYLGLPSIYLEYAPPIVRYPVLVFFTSSSFSTFHPET